MELAPGPRLPLSAQPRGAGSLEGGGELVPRGRKSGDGTPGASSLPWRRRLRLNWPLHWPAPWQDRAVEIHALHGACEMRAHGCWTRRLRKPGIVGQIGKSGVQCSSRAGQGWRRLAEQALSRTLAPAALHRMRWDGSAFPEGRRSHPLNEARRNEKIATLAVGERLRRVARAYSASAEGRPCAIRSMDERAGSRAQTGAPVGLEKQKFGDALPIRSSATAEARWARSPPGV